MQEILNLTIQYFSKLKIENPRLEAEVLLADLLGKERIDLYVSFDQPLNPEEVDVFREQVRLRGKGCPIPYIIGKKEFLSREFYVSQDVLIPRPETEHLVEVAIHYLDKSQALRVADIGTGSGIISISLALSLPRAHIYATDISFEALKMAEKNVKRYHLEKRIDLLQGDLFSPLHERRFHAILSNPPYIPDHEYRGLVTGIREYEPPKALKGGRDGLRVIRPLITGAKDYLNEEGLLILEIGYGQLSQVRQLLKEHSYKLEDVIKDYGDIPRVVLARWG